MQHPSAIRPLLQKFIENRCTPEETEQVISYFRENRMTDDFPEVDDIRELLETLPEMSEATSSRIFNSVMEKGTTVVPAGKRPYRRYIAIAASFLILISAGISWKMGYFNRAEPIPPDGTEITIQLENGDVRVISQDGTEQIVDPDGNIVGKRNGSKITYDRNSGKDELVYNTIRVPFGKRFELALSDGTHIHLNAGTSLKYPVKFVVGADRRVFLEGEAFFDVAKDPKHPFVVNSDQLDTRVLGTHFNVTCYPEDDSTDVVLVEGSVGMYGAGAVFDARTATVLRPGYKGSFGRTSGKIDVSEVNTELYTAWIDGRIFCRNADFANIARKLERKYDVTIRNRNLQLASGRFSANLGDVPLENVLRYFSEINHFTYTINGKIVEIK